MFVTAISYSPLIFTLFLGYVISDHFYLIHMAFFLLCCHYNSSFTFTAGVPLDNFYFTLFQVGGARLPWSTAHLGKGNSDNKPMGRRDSSALVGNSVRRKLWIQTYKEWNLLALSLLARPWQLNLLLFCE